MATTKLTVVMPAYNEEAAIEEAVADVRRNVLDAIPGSELVVVNDGSRDRTGEILDRLAAEDGRVRVVHKPNGGHGPAIITGLGQARGEYVFLVDSDLQIPLEAFGPLWEATQQGGRYDCAFGVRRKRHDPTLRLYLTRLIRATIPMFFGVKLYDANVPYKLLRRSIWEEARQHIPDDTLAPSLFLAVYCKRRGYRVAEIDVPHKERETGVVSIRRWKLFKFCARAFRQMLDFRRSLTQAPAAARRMSPAVGA